jgi:spermidine synthase
VLHSQFNPRRIATGSVWDLLWLGIFFQPQPAPRRALLLGLGAGTAVTQLQALFPKIAITAIESDPIHIQLATRHFGIDSSRADIHRGDARDFMSDYQGPPFDLIIDDLFSGSSGMPSRAVPCSLTWLRGLERCLSEAGTLSVNFADLKELKASGIRTILAEQKRFKQGYGFRHPSLENVIATLLTLRSKPDDLRAQILSVPSLASALRHDQLRYRVRELKTR